MVYVRAHRSRSAVRIHAGAHELIVFLVRGHVGALIAGSDVFTAQTVVVEVNEGVYLPGGPAVADGAGCLASNLDVDIGVADADVNILDRLPSESAADVCHPVSGRNQNRRFLRLGYVEALGADGALGLRPSSVINQLAQGVEVVAVGAAFACGGFCKLFGGDWMAFLFASICAFAGYWTRQKCNHFGINPYMTIAIAAFVATCLAYASTMSGLSQTPYHPLLACALFVVPGVPLINFVDDLIDNYLQVGLVRATNVMVTMGAMAFGIFGAIKALSIQEINIDKKFSELSMVPHDTYLAYALAAAISAVGFSMIFNIQRRLLWVVAIGGMIAVCTRNFVNFELGYGPVIGSFMGAFVVSLIAVKAVHIFHVPNHVLTIPSVIPMIPGVLMYRSLFAFINMTGVVGEVTTAVYNGINSAMIILVISIGVAFPNIMVRRFIAKDRQRFLNEELERRRQRGKFIEW